MTIFKLANLGALVRNWVHVVCSAGRIGVPTVDSAHAYRIALADAEATQDARLQTILAPLTEAIARLHEKLDSILAKL